MLNRVKIISNVFGDSERVVKNLFFGSEDINMTNEEYVEKFLGLADEAVKLMIDLQKNGCDMEYVLGMTVLKMKMKYRDVKTDKDLFKMFGVEK